MAESLSSNWPLGQTRPGTGMSSFPIIPASSHDQGTSQNPCPPHCPLLPRRTVQAASQVAMHQLPSDWWVADSSEHEGAQSANCAARVSFTSNSQHAFPTQTSAERFEMEYNIYIYILYIFIIYIFYDYFLRVISPEKPIDTSNRSGCGLRILRSLGVATISWSWNVSTETNALCPLNPTDRLDWFALRIKERQANS